MIKYFCDVCEDETDKDNVLCEFTIATKSLAIPPTTETILLMIQVCTNCIKRLKEDPKRMLQRVIRGY